MVREPQPLTGILLDEETRFTLDEFANACAVQSAWLVELVDEGILEPEGAAPERWRFSGVMVRRVRTARRLQRDLGINLAGVALALELLEEIETLRTRLRFFGE